MQANPRTIDALFNSQSRYVVPMFQRLYSWSKDPQWDTLWEDLTGKAELQIQGKQSAPHYLGALIIEGVRPSSPREVKRFLVIDGQQRLTTLQLLICAFRDVARSKGWIALDKTATSYLENANQDVMENPEEEALKLWPTTLNRDVFRDIVTLGSYGAIAKKHPLVYPPRKKKPLPRSKLVEAYLFFHDALSMWTFATAKSSGKSEEDVAFAFLQSLQQDFCVVEISLSDGDDSQEIFYSLNSQGKPLSQSDLLRSLIFMRAEKLKLNRDKIFDKCWSGFETPFWSFEVKRGGRAYSRLDLGLRYFLITKTGQMIDARRVNEEYRSWIEAPRGYASLEEELADLSRHGAVYERYEAPAEGVLPSTDLRRILRDLEVSTAVPLIMYLELDGGLDDKQLAQCLASLESFVCRRVFVGEENKEYNKFFVDVVADLIASKARGADVHPALLRKLLSGGGSTRRWPTDNEVVEKAITREISKELKQSALRVFLERLEIASRTKKSEDANVAPNLQIEHVLPVKWGAHWPLADLAIPQKLVDMPLLAREEFEPHRAAIRARNSKLQTLGNLTLLNMYLNPAASNGSYETKLYEYKQSVLVLSRHFANKSQWDEAAIEERGRQLGALLCNIWPRPEEPK